VFDLLRRYAALQNFQREARQMEERAGSNLPAPLFSISATSLQHRSDFSNA
jgi:hypothetical protein